jgi:hypothetical protein
MMQPQKPRVNDAAPYRLSPPSQLNPDIPSDDEPDFFMEPEIATEWDEESQIQMESFVTALHRAPKITVAALLGHPKVIPEENLPDADLARELSRILYLLKEERIFIEKPNGTPPRELYRYITGILLPQEVEDLDIEGLSRHFYFSSHEDHESE